MPNGDELEVRPSFRQWLRGNAALHWITRHAGIEIAIFLALAAAAFFLGRELFDTRIPIQGDVRSHVFKIELLQSYLSNFSWPQWNPWWYHGIPEDQFYPPGFYFLSALLSFIVNSSVVAYKILLFLALAFNGLAIFFFTRRFLKFDSHLAVWCLIVYETSTPLLINFMYGEGPNLLGWSVTLGFLTVYLSQAMENKTRGLVNIILPGIMLGVAILIHPFPVIFAIMAVIIFHVVWLLHKRSWKIFSTSQLPYFAGVFAIGAIVGMYYWLPAFLTLHYSSPIYSTTKFQWPGGTIYLLALVFLALAVFLATRYKLRHDPVLDFIFFCFCLASALGFGGTNYLPFGLGSLVQEFRFSSIVIPFFSILLIVYPLQYRRFRIDIPRLVMAITIGVFLTALVFGLDKREAFIAGIKALPHLTAGSFYNLVTQQFSPSFPNFATSMLPYFAIIVFLALVLGRKTATTSNSHPAFIIAGGACLLLLTSFVPYINTASQVNLGDLTRYVDNYEQPQYAQTMNSVKDGRLIVPPNKGFLTEGDSPVTFGWRWGVETVNGPYNQGDPKFFKFTVHLEWEERWLNYQWVRENLMQESAAKYIFIREPRALPNNLNGMVSIVDNSYGKILALNQTVTYANSVTPILVDLAKVREATEFFNILMPSGYKMVLVNVNEISPELINKFTYVMIDDESKAARYADKTVFILTDSTTPGLSENPGIVRLNLPYLTYTNKIFYHGDIADGYMWIGWDNWQGSKITSEMQTVIESSGRLLSSYISRLDYTSAGYSMTDNRIAAAGKPGFTLIKDTYFPYWKTDQGNLMPTSQGFMLVYSEVSDITLNYQKPFYYIFATVCSILGLIILILALVGYPFYKRLRKSTTNHN